MTLLRIALPVLVRDRKASINDFEVSRNEYGLFLQPGCHPLLGVCGKAAKQI
jgi:hypothetical protein